MSFSISSCVGLSHCRCRSAPFLNFLHTTSPLLGKRRQRPFENNVPRQSLGNDVGSSSNPRAGPRVRSRSERLAKKWEQEAKMAADSTPTQFRREEVPHSFERDIERRKKSLSRPKSRTVNHNSVRYQRDVAAYDGAKFGEKLRKRRGDPLGSSDWEAAKSAKPDRPSARPVKNHIIPEFMPPSDVTHFSSPPLLPGLVESITDVLGPNVRPTPIQALSLQHLFNEDSNQWRQFLLASETGSGKSIAYLLPMLQALKKSELVGNVEKGHLRPRRALNPRGLILAPTHELARQLSGFAKDLLHNIKLRVQCASRANVENDGRNSTSSKMAQHFDIQTGRGAEFSVSGPKSGRGAEVDVLVGTPNRILEMVRGYRWADLEEEGTIRKREPEMGLQAVEWVVVDEADVLFDPDFIDTTKLLLADISSSRGQPVPSIPSPFDPPSDRINSPPTHSENQPKMPSQYPFNLILTSATIPSSLSTYLDNHHPNIKRLASPGLHKLPRGLQIEYVGWTGGSRWADVENRIRKVWAEDAVRTAGEKSKVLIFCNKGTTVDTLGKYLKGKGVANVALTRNGELRKKGSNRHLEGFLKQKKSRSSTPTLTRSPKPQTPTSESEQPHVLITTSLLSRGLDFAPSIRHVLIPEPPRNMVDFLHRSGRSGRAGEWGRVVVFVKMKGRGSLQGREVRKKIGELTARKSQMFVLDDESQWDGGLETDWGLEDGGSERGKEFALGRDGSKLRRDDVVPGQDPLKLTPVTMV